jgi:hypothetical protein
MENLGHNLEGGDVLLVFRVAEETRNIHLESKLAQPQMLLDHF